MANVSKKLKYFSLGLVTLVGLVAMACGGSSTSDGSSTGDGSGTSGGSGTGDGNSTISTPIKIGYLADYSGPLAEFGPNIEKGVELAVKQLNEAGKINGSTVEFVTGDTGLDATKAISEASRLINVENVYGIVGALASGISQQVAESVTGQNNIPQISPSSTSPALTGADDNGYLFRTALSDAAQGKALADLVSSDGVDNVGVMVVNNSYGVGLADVFESSFSGTIARAEHGEEQATYLSELNKAKANGAEYLVAIGYPPQAKIYLREAIENGLFEKFFFVDGTKSEELKDAIGAEALFGFKGTAPGSGPESTAAKAFNDAYIAEYGELTSAPFVKEAYDATILLALAAAKAGSTNGPDVRDALVDVASGSGIEVVPSVGSIKAGLEALSNGQNVNYQGASSTVEFNADGDITDGYVEIWEFNSEGSAEAIRTEPFSLGS